MNPFQLAVCYNNTKALDFMATKLASHLRTNLMAPHISCGALQIKDFNLIYKECWPLFVAINHRSQPMLKYIWEEFGCLRQNFG
mmetsp:Transcript_32819/g.50123  ORF Transcript_32819/g.50123 Transcript_32819/m.50123 type:complete len:84 (+) Transcript_32819:886-1137(+)